MILMSVRTFVNVKIFLLLFAINEHNDSGKHLLVFSMPTLNTDGPLMVKLAFVSNIRGT